jgi:hypothetical protein
LDKGKSPYLPPKSTPPASPYPTLHLYLINAYPSTYGPGRFMDSVITNIQDVTDHPEPIRCTSFLSLFSDPQAHHPLTSPPAPFQIHPPTPNPPIHTTITSPVSPSASPPLSRFHPYSPSTVPPNFPLPLLRLLPTSSPLPPSPSPPPSPYIHHDFSFVRRGLLPCLMMMFHCLRLRGIRRRKLLILPPTSHWNLLLSPLLH